ncbi:hypothetical protein GC102_10725 [Paenibacillus sp. LMG 31460]|uniref:DUF1436 family protein n=1 Tax=Paenibacillus germinis TaxID=2654979 RepID=A0ABX1YYN5_9BACL|nr:hypothetical protein [Paenibacillus germinis]NOU86245.1 hypothetical protein [Paenibacillus germinis]
MQVYYIVTAYMNKRQEIFLNATATNPIGINAATNRILTIKSPYTPESLGEQIENSLGICLREPVWDEKMQGKVQDFLGFKSKVLFQKEHVHVIIEFNKDSSVMKFLATRREGSGYVSVDKSKFEVELPVDKEALGRLLIKAFQLCQ